MHGTTVGKIKIQIKMDYIKLVIMRIAAFWEMAYSCRRYKRLLGAFYFHIT